MEALMPRVRGMERKALQSALCFLGQKIGHEWARDNNVCSHRPGANRVIDTADLEAWGDRLRSSGDVLSEVEAIETLAAARLQARR